MFTTFIHSTDVDKAEAVSNRLSAAQNTKYSRLAPVGLLKPVSIVVHATHNSHFNTQANNEAKYLSTSPDVSIHALIGRNSQLYTIVPFETIAWHAGKAYVGYRNTEALGVELHSSYDQLSHTGEPLIGLQRSLLVDLLTYWSHQFNIGRDRVKRHADIAIYDNGKTGRKIDPACLDRVAFDTLLTEVWWYDTK